VLRENGTAERICLTLPDGVSDAGALKAELKPADA
jgi:hypothetical protein